MDELDAKRQMTRSVSSLHNTATSNTPNSDDLHPDEHNLRSQYGYTSGGGMSQSIRNLHKLSNPDLTALENYSNKNSSTTGDNSTPESAYYSTTLPKSLRKGAVQKRLERNNNSQRNIRVDQTTSGDSDASDISPMSKKSAVFQRANQFRSISSVDNNSSNMRGGRLLTVAPQKMNYLAQRLKNGYELEFFGAKAQQKSGSKAGFFRWIHDTPLITQF
jgi:hypothetical protein